MGFCDFEAGPGGEDFLARLHHHSIPEFRWEDGGAKPENVVVTKHKGRTFNRIIEPFLRDNKGFNGPVFFAATLGTNTLHNYW